MPIRFITVVRPLLVILALGLRTAALAAPGEDASIAEARSLFVRGNELAKGTQWAQALAAFERSNELRPHPLTTFNVAICERALGNLLRARALFEEALASGVKDPSQFPASRVQDARGYLSEIDASVVHLEVHAQPEDALLAVDGRPLEVAPGADVGEASKSYLAGTAKPGAPARVPGSRFAMVVDPGTHVFRVVAKGYGDIVLTKTFTPGQNDTLAIELARLPATVRVSSDVAESIVTVNDADVGFAPVQVSRPAGAYRIVVRREGFETFTTKLALTPGQDLDLPAKLPKEHVPITKRWWFWGGVVGVVAGGALLTYALTREEPAPEPYAGGTMGWVVTPR